MFARIARFEGVAPEQQQRMVEEITQDPRPPEGVPATRFMMLFDREAGTGLAIAFFDSEDDMRAGHEVLDGMTPPASGSGRRASVEFYEVPLDIES